MGFKKFWLLGLAGLLQFSSAWQFIKWALDWRGRYDAMGASYREIGGVDAMIGSSVAILHVGIEIRDYF